MAPERTIMGIISKGITIYMVTAELKVAEMFNPNKLANTAVENRTSQYSRYIPLISRMLLAMSTNVMDWIADRTTRITILLDR
jgi:hypothetical protein